MLTRSPRGRRCDLRGRKTSTSARGIRMTGSPLIIPIPNRVDQMKKIRIRKCQVNRTRVLACGTCHISPGHECDLFWNPDVSIHCAKCCEIVQEDKEKWAKMRFENEMAYKEWERRKDEEGGRDA